MRLKSLATGLSLMFLVPGMTHAMTVMDVEITCPVGGEEFTARLAGSGTAFGANLDRRPFGATPSPWPLARCPGNGFVLYQREFSDAEVARLTPLVESAEFQRMQAEESDYYIASRLMRHMNAPANLVADRLLKATWEAEHDERYPRYASEALAAFEHVLADASSELTAETRASYQQIAGELERRLGRFEEAARRFEALLQSPGVIGSELEPLVRQEIALVAAKDSGTHAIETPDEAAE